jgi:integral membrane sensor domain MASE1
MDGAPLSVISVATGMGLATGDAVQAWVGAWAVRRWIGWPLQLHTKGEGPRFLLLAGPAPAVIGASSAVIFFMLRGSVAIGETPFLWIATWLGHAMATLLVAPMMLAPFARRSCGREPEPCRRSTSPWRPAIREFAP